MPKKKPTKAKPSDVDLARADWYVYHFEKRQLVKSLDPSTLQKYQTLAAMCSIPIMTRFGGASFDPDHVPPDVYAKAHQQGLDAALINPWYLTESGWQVFQQQWQRLPEYNFDFHKDCVEFSDLSTLSTVDEIKMP